MAAEDDKLPFLLDLQTTSSQEQIATLRTEYKKQVAAGKVNPQTKFDYSYNLVKSAFKKDHEAGLQLLHELYKENPARRRECLYYLSIGNYKLANYVEARKFNEILLQMEPRNTQSLKLRDLIDSKVRTDGLIGMAIVGGIAAAAIALGAAFFGGSKKH
ncbi:UNVERIFIED_CONTAM: mitochondrial membrane protein [Siphonaria sp. JEL0065]|nr:mitochondrial membrane protein [Siphonaria sp. JEL0065]